MVDQGYAFKNKLLANLAPADIAALAPYLQKVPLTHRQEIELPQEGITEVLFPEEGLLSMIATLPRGRDIEVGIIGRDGMSGTAVVQDDDQSPFLTIVQIKGSAFSIDADLFRDALAERASMRGLFNRYARSLAIQIASTALSNGRGKLEERLARWLVMVQDRIDSERIVLTHDFLALMLGVRRPGVTVAIHILEGKGLVRSIRGEILIRDREGLVELADGAYGLAEGEYRRLMGMPS